MEPKKRNTVAAFAGREPHGCIQIAYTIDSTIGKGGWANVYSAKIERWDSDSTDEQASAAPVGQVVALKRVGLDERFKQRELETHRGLSHPHMVEVLASFHEEKTESSPKYLNMFMAPKLPTDLSTIALPLAHDQALTYAKQLLSALAYLHAPPRYIAHRDIKLPNVLVDVDDIGVSPYGKVALCDFGCAKDLRPGVVSHPVYGQREIRAPEGHFMSTSYGPEVDVFSLALLIIHLIAGKALLTPMDSEEQQRDECVRVLGVPTAEEMRDILGDNVQDDDERMQFTTLESAVSIKVALASLELPPPTERLLESMLQYSPRRRLSAEGAVTHEAISIIEVQSCPP